MEKQKKPRPTQDRLKELFHYDPETGLFVRKTTFHPGPKDRKYGRVGAGRISELGYVLLMIDDTNYIAGQVAWAYVHGAWPHARIKYIDGDKINNRISNIRVQDLVADDVKATKLTLERLKELVHYEPTTGWFTWRINNSTAKPGMRVGSGHGLGYRQIGLDYKKYLEHSLAYFYMTGEWPTKQIDHINRDKSDNRWENIRHGSISDNGHNKGVSARSRTGLTGVLPHGNGFRSMITVDSKSQTGWFNTIAEARVSRLLLEIKNFGKFTSFNIDLDGSLPCGDKTISLMAGGNKLFILENGVPREINDVSELKPSIN